MKEKVYLKQQLLNDTITTKRYGKGILVQIKEEDVYKILTNKEFTNKTDSPFEKLEPQRKFNTSCGTIYSRNLAEFTKEEIMAMCPKDMVDGDRIMGPQIIKREFEKDTLNSHIIIGRENI